MRDQQHVETSTSDGDRSMEGPDDVRAVLAEVVATRDTADRTAREGVPATADTTSVLAGLISQLAGQVERLARLLGPAEPRGSAGTSDR